MRPIRHIDAPFAIAHADGMMISQPDAAEDPPPKRPCPTCNGEGGWWDTGNGEKFKNRRWVTCTTCKGNKYV
jgi:DnaJ-class molecular chaperone